METASAPLGKAMYVASSLDKSWLQSVQRKLFQQSQKQPDYVFAKLWGLITDPHNLRIAFARVAANRGRRTAGTVSYTHLDVYKRQQQAKRSCQRESDRALPGRGWPGVARSALRDLLRLDRQARSELTEHASRTRQPVAG